MNKQQLAAKIWDCLLYTSGNTGRRWAGSASNSLRKQTKSCGWSAAFPRRSKAES